MVIKPTVASKISTPLRVHHVMSTKKRRSLVEILTSRSPDILELHHPSHSDDLFCIEHVPT